MRHFSGAHVIIQSSDAEADRVFLRDVLDLESVDGGDGWLIFALPPAEVGVHPGKNSRYELYLVCSDLDGTLSELKAKGVAVGAASEQRWGRLASMTLPGGGELPIYEPQHLSPPHR